VQKFVQKSSACHAVGLGVMQKNMNIVEQLTEQQIVQLHELYSHEWWSNSRTLTQTKRCVAGSQIIIGITEMSGNLIGFTRVLTDYTFKALMFDVIIHQDYRNENLGSKLINLVKIHPELKNVVHFELYCLPELFEFYKKHGFTNDVGGMQLMRYINT